MADIKNILFLSHSANLFGAERSLLDLVLGLDRSSFKPTVLLPTDGPLRAALHKANVQTMLVPYRNWVGADYLALCPYRTLRNLVTFSLYKRKVEQLEPDLIYTNTSVFPFGGMLAMSLQVPHIWHLREFVDKDIGAAYYYGRRASLRFIARSAQQVVCNSQALQKHVADIIPETRLATVYNGVLDESEASLFDAKPGVSSQRSYEFCMIGSIAPHKGHAEALRALALLRSRDSIDARLRIVGSGPPRVEKRLRQQAAALGLDEAVKWEGYCSEVAGIYRRADATLVCSRYEPFGRVAVESMAVGTPVIGTAAGGLTEIIEDGNTGLLYPPGNHTVLADQIKRLIRDDALYARISGDGQQDVYQRFTRERYLTAMLTIIGSLLEQAQHPLAADTPEGKRR